jgi:uncharacterized membrane protein YgdD (TMEM256/DUF423 family)
MKRFWLVAGSTSMLLALVIAAATGHATETGTEAGAREALATARELHLVHSGALLLLDVLPLGERDSTTWNLAGAAFLGGILLFPCGIYASRIFGINEIRPLIPVGGAAFMLGWLLFAAAALRLRSS